ncbi:MAG TPA: sigma-70 family RNA polymerase sigma factor, partial [Candidatus Paceibacterota bacterium]|nr:sigma-70 family RNA polymerase sigma factor [Candidatus Paceibacterota bacterium]
QNVKGYEHRGHPFSSWLYQIARNQIVDHYRAKKATVAIEAVDPEIFAAAASVESALPAKLAMETVGRAIRQLKPDYQDVVILRYVEDISLKETAAALGKTEGAVKLMQHRAIQELKRLLKDESF